MHASASEVTKTKKVFSRKQNHNLC